MREKIFNISFFYSNQCKDRKGETQNNLAGPKKKFKNTHPNDVANERCDEHVVKFYILVLQYIL